MANIIIYGAGVTGRALQRSLVLDNNIWLYDDNANYSSIAMCDIPYDCIDMCIVSPGIDDRAPLLAELHDREIPIVGEWQYCFDRCGDTIVSVTGTNGKTTITQMIHKILDDNSMNNALLGNGGIAWSSDIGTGDRVTVLESSSFQLDKSGNFAPYISVLSNISSDHISYHGSMDNYISSKCHNFGKQNSSQWAIFNADDTISVKLADRCTAIALTYSVANDNANCYITNGQVIINIDNTVSCDMGVLSSYCTHDKSNALSAILVCYLLGVDITNSIKSLDSYIVGRHKLQHICTCGGISYIDDSKATNIHATLSAIDSVSGSISLILGGSSKGYGFDELIGNLPSRVVGVAVVGDTTQMILDSCTKYEVDCVVCNDMKTAVLHSKHMLPHGGTVLLSPACASFDKYHSYADRGDHFANIVAEVSLC